MNVRLLSIAMYPLGEFFWYVAAAERALIDHERSQGFKVHVERLSITVKRYYLI